MLGGAGPLLAALFAAAALTNDEPRLHPQPLLPNETTNLQLAPLSSAPIVHLGGPRSVFPLKPGVYQTRPFAMILIVPKRGIDDGCIAGTTGAGSRMPVVKPEQRTVPIPTPK